MIVFMNMLLFPKNVSVCVNYAFHVGLSHTKFVCDIFTNDRDISHDASIYFTLIIYKLAISVRVEIAILCQNIFWT